MKIGPKLLLSLVAIVAILFSISLVEVYKRIKEHALILVEMNTSKIPGTNIGIIELGIGLFALNCFVVVLLMVEAKLKHDKKHINE
ncbi:hypothetical protein ACQKND_16105 [Viridibacillus arvi]|uniref:hypothetical protein n=1 Tax=Viridibacillus arvi TaxID=263475 RepID=UPI003D06FF61